VEKITDVLLKITNACGMGCSHCMEGSTPAGKHMTREIFLAALALTERLEGLAWSRGIPRRLLISGGEATEHPDVVEYLTTARDRGFQIILITNGMWLDDPDLRAKILRPEWPDLLVQVTNDPRFYPTAPKSIPRDDPRVVFVPSLTHLIPIGRLKPSRAPASLPLRKSPTSFNLRSLTRSFHDVREALVILRARATVGMSGNCSPSISSDGTIVAGESSNCFAIGDVHSTADQITHALVHMTCNKCSLVDGLSQEQKRAIGEAP